MFGSFFHLKIIASELMDYFITKARWRRWQSFIKKENNEILNFLLVEVSWMRWRWLLSLFAVVQRQQFPVYWRVDHK